MDLRVSNLDPLDNGFILHDCPFKFETLQAAECVVLGIVSSDVKFDNLSNTHHPKLCHDFDLGHFSKPYACIHKNVAISILS